MLIGEILIDKYGVERADLEKALQFQNKFGGLTGSILMNMGIISEEILLSALSDQLNLKTFKDIDEETLNFAAFRQNGIINVNFILKHQWVPLRKDNETFFFAAVNPLDHEIVQYLTDLEIKWVPYLVTESQFRELAGEYEISTGIDDVKGLNYPEMLDGEIDKLRELASEAPIVNLVNGLVSKAVVRGASDLHFEPYKNMYRVRFRIDGMLHDVDFLPLKMQLPVASRIKILAGMDIAERRKPQDGQIAMKIASKDLDVRVSALPLAEGESLVLRFLIKESIEYDLNHLGLEPDLIDMLSYDISRSGGVILLTGPTGSGKTTTLYSCINKINSEEKKIITIEDPVEYQLDGINQIQVRPEIGYDFLTALRSILRQDPDVIMIGEIRDKETARVAMRSSLTGHLVLSTIHTNDAPSAYTRLIDLGVEEYLINSSLISVIAQRLARRVCSGCAEVSCRDPSRIRAYGLEDLAKRYKISKAAFKNAAGCPACNHTGYRGRVGIMEYLRCTPELKKIPKDSGFTLNARQYMKKNNVRSLAEDGFLKVLRGMTTIEEILRVCE